MRIRLRRRRRARAYAKAADDGKTVVVADLPEEKADQGQSIMDRVTSDGGSSDEGGVGSVRSSRRSLCEQGEDHQRRRPCDLQRQRSAGQETVTLTTETVGAERRSADRVLTSEEAEAAFEGKTVEMMGSREEAEVHKEARDVGEVELTREAKERQKTVKDSVRKTDVEVEQIGAGTTTK